jgi:hypothetical protein
MLWWITKIYVVPFALMLRWVTIILRSHLFCVYILILLHHPVNDLLGTVGTAFPIQAFKDRDPACAQYSWALLYLKVCIMRSIPGCCLGRVWLLILLSRIKLPVASFSTMLFVFFDIRMPTNSYRHIRPWCPVSYYIAYMLFFRVTNPCNRIGYLMYYGTRDVKFWLWHCKAVLVRWNLIS